MKKEKIITIVIVVTVILSLSVLIGLMFLRPEEEIELCVNCAGKNIFTVIGNTTDERTMHVYYNFNKGSADREFNFYILQTPSFIISLNDRQLFPVTDKSPWIIEKIRLTSLYEFKHVALVVSPLGEKDCFFETDTFTLAWSCADYRDHKDFLIRYYNVDKVRSLNWNVPEGFNLSIDNAWFGDHFVEATTNYNGWYTLKGHLSSYNEPWRDTDVYLWYKPDTFETHIEVRT